MIEPATTDQVAWPKTAWCRQCGTPFVKNRKDKLYCSPQCQDPGRYSRTNLDQSIRVNQELTVLDRRWSMAELVKAFEAATGQPLVIRLEHLPRRRSFKAPELTWEDTTRKGFHWGREEQGKLYWNVPGQVPVVDEQDPIEVERQLLASRPTEQPHQGETEVEWRARGGVPRTMPPGRALAL